MVLGGDLPVTALSRLRPPQVVSAFDAFTAEDLQDLGISDAAAARGLLSDITTKLKVLSGGKVAHKSVAEEVKAAMSVGRRRRSREAAEEQPAAAKAH